MPISENLLTSIKNGKFKGDLNLCNKAIDDADATKLALALKENPYVTCLHLRNQNIGDIGIKAISEVTTIEELDVGNGADDYSEEFGNRITSVGAEALSKSCLKKLNISGNSIGDSGIKFLAESQTIVELIAEDCEISSVGAVSLFTRNALIKKLDLSDNPIGDEGISSISLNHKIEELNLSNCSITGNGSDISKY